MLAAFESDTELAWGTAGTGQALGAYRVEHQTGAYGKPRWPKLTHDKALDIVFAEREIFLIDDPLMKRFLGDVVE
jgi:hypothetical protein